MIVDSGPAPGRAARAAAILRYWLADLDDASLLQPSAEPFATCYQRWYGKRPEIDSEIRSSFEADLDRATQQPPRWFGEELEAWTAAVPHGPLALVVLLDQLPRNMYRGSARMYAHDALALSAARHAIAHYAGSTLPLVWRMFLYVPLMHVESREVQREMVGRFEELAAQAEARSPQNRAFFQHALGSARRHSEVIDRFGRFPHRNAILGRASTTEEEEHLLGPDPGF